MTSEPASGIPRRKVSSHEAPSMTGVVIPGLVAGVIFAVIAVATGVSAGAAIIGGLVVAALAIGVGLIVRSTFKRRAGSRRE